jgi:hypothetical protein
LASADPSTIKGIEDMGIGAGNGKDFTVKTFARSKKDIDSSL